MLQMSASGTFTESTVVPAMSAVKIDKDIPLTAAALIGCGVLTGFGAARNTADIRQGDTVAVVGCGGVGLNVIQAPSTRAPSESSPSTWWTGSCKRPRSSRPRTS